MAVTLCLSRSLDAQLEVQRPTLLGDGFLYCILSTSSLNPNSIRAPEGPFGRVWLSLPQLVYRRLQLYWNCPWLPSWLRYIIVQRPLDRWNRMFNRYQAEITVMQFWGTFFRCVSLWEYHGIFFNLSHFVSQFPPMRFPLLTAIGICHFLPVHHLEWHFGPGRKSKYNTNTFIDFIQ